MFMHGSTLETALLELTIEKRQTVETIIDYFGFNFLVVSSVEIFILQSKTFQV